MDIKKTNKCVLDFSPLFDAVVVNRPSKVNKSPYLADIKINNKVIMAHTPALGLGGLIIPNAKVKVKAKCKDKTGKRCSDYSIEKVKVGKTWVGANPTIANTILKNTIQNKLFIKLKNIILTRQEVVVGDSRLDFMGKDNHGNQIYLEVKNVPLVDYHQSEAPTSRKVLYSTQQKNKYQRVAVFPDGSAKLKDDMVSPRAYKHLLTLEKLSKKPKTRAILIYIIQRSDCYGLLPNYLRDPKYGNKIYQIMKNSKVEIYALAYQWRKDKLYFQKELPIISKKNYYFWGKVSTSTKK